jgi:hypothetical protein
MEYMLIKLFVKELIELVIKGFFKIDSFKFQVILRIKHITILKSIKPLIKDIINKHNSIHINIVIATIINSNFQGSIINSSIDKPMVKLAKLVLI